MHAFRLWDFHLYRADYLSERIHTRPEIELRLYQVRAHTLEKKPWNFLLRYWAKPIPTLLSYPSRLSSSVQRKHSVRRRSRNSDAWSLNNSKLDSHDMANAQCFLSREEDSHKALGALVDQINKTQLEPDGVGVFGHV